MPLHFVKALALTALLSACGAAGAPERPDAKTPATGVAVTGEITLGLAKNGG